MAQSSKDTGTFGGIVKMDKTVHDFGDILVTDGPVSCTFTATNVSSKAMVIYNVVSSCGCTNVEWTRQPIKPGEKGTIKATYKNDDGAYPFDKTLTVYVSDVKQPIILRLRGESHEKKLSLKEMYPARFGNLGVKSVEIKGGNLSQEQQKSGEFVVANLGTKPMNLSFSNISKGLALKVSQNPIPAGSTAKVAFTVTADRTLWGKNWYYATPVVDGKQYKAVVSSVSKAPAKGAEAVVADPNPELGAGKEKLGIFAITKENFSSWTDEQKDNASTPIADESTYSFGKVASGKQVKGAFAIANKGKSPLKFYKVDSESSRLQVNAAGDILAGKKGSLDFTLDTDGLPNG